MKIQDKIYLSILFLLVAISFLNVTVNRMVFDRKVTSQVMLDEKLILGIPIPSEKEIKKRATINVPEGSKRRSRIYTGTAFHVDGGIWLTARHVIDSCNAIYVSNFNDKKDLEPKLLEKVFVHPHSDMAAFTLSGERDFLSPPHFDDKKYKSFLRQTAFSFGFPVGQPGTLGLKYFGKAALKNDNFKISEPIFVWSVAQKNPKTLGSVGGLSGGPLLNNQYELIGLIVAEQLRRGTVSSATLQSINWILEALYEKMGSEYNFTAKTELSSIDGDKDVIIESNAIMKVFCRS